MIKQIDDNLYETICEWWDDRSFPRIPKEILPTGYMVWSGEVPVLAGWLYLPIGEAKIGMFMWPASNPKASSLLRAQAWDELMAHIDQVARDHGLWMLYSGTADPLLIKRMESHGYVVHEGGSANMLKKL